MDVFSHMIFFHIDVSAKILVFRLYLDSYENTI